MLPRRLRFGVCFSTAIIGACPNENFVSRDLAISDYSDRLLVLLHHKVCGRMCLAVEAAQHGHRGNLRTRIAISRRRMVAIEFGMCRSGRRGGASGSV